MKLWHADLGDNVEFGYWGHALLLAYSFSVAKEPFIKETLPLFSAFLVYQALYVQCVFAAMFGAWEAYAQVTVGGLGITISPQKLGKINGIAQGDTSSKWQRVTQSSSISDIWPSTGPSLLISKSFSGMISKLGEMFDSRAVGS